VHKINEEYKLGNVEEDKFLTVKACDNTNDKAYTIKFPGTFIGQENKEEARRKATEILEIISNEDAKILGEDNLNHLRQRCENSSYWGELNINDIELYDLSREDYLATRSILTELSNVLYPKNLEQTI